MPRNLGDSARLPRRRPHAEHRLLLEREEVLHQELNQHHAALPRGPGSVKKFAPRRPSSSPDRRGFPSAARRRPTALRNIAWLMHHAPCALAALAERVDTSECSRVYSLTTNAPPITPPEPPTDPRDGGRRPPGCRRVRAVHAVCPRARHGRDRRPLRAEQRHLDDHTGALGARWRVRRGAAPARPPRGRRGCRAALELRKRPDRARATDVHVDVRALVRHAHREHGRVAAPLPHSPSRSRGRRRAWRAQPWAVPRQRATTAPLGRGDDIVRPPRRLREVRPAAHPRRVGPFPPRIRPQKRGCGRAAGDAAEDARSAPDLVCTRAREP